jgi:hypothetical protein
MGDNVITFSGPQSFSQFLDQNNFLAEEMEALNTIKSTARHIEIGCKCKRKERKRTANETYSNVLLNYLPASGKEKIKEALSNPDKIIFKYYDDYEDTEKTVLVIE